MFSKIITVLFAAVISAANGFFNSKLRVLEPIIGCHKTNAPEFAGEKAMAAGLNLHSDADDVKLFCLTMEVSSQTKLMPDKLNQDIFKLDYTSLIHTSIHPSINLSIDPPMYLSIDSFIPSSTDSFTH